MSSGFQGQGNGQSFFSQENIAVQAIWCSCTLAAPVLQVPHKQISGSESVTAR
jgi:hypothetical protein